MHLLPGQRQNPYGIYMNLIKWVDSADVTLQTAQTKIFQKLKIDTGIVGESVSLDAQYS